MTRLLGKTEVLSILDRVVEKHGPHTKRAAVYLHRDVPTCIAACFLDELGVPVEQIRTLGNGSIYALHEHYGPSDLGIDVRLTDAGANVLMWAQDYQDDDEEWGDVVRRVHKQADDELRDKE